ncbi:MAG TPA: rRNA methyltransferase, partial [Planctomycetes bacterium]|nr:rRNA methyltransferase [Planctomycetota bacterium]
AAAAAKLEPRALAAHEGAPLGAEPLPSRCLLLLGAEGPGLPEDADALPALTIEGAPGAESLNVAVAFAVAAHTWQGGSR